MTLRVGPVDRAWTRELRAVIVGALVLARPCAACCVRRVMCVARYVWRVPKRLPNKRSPTKVCSPQTDGMRVGEQQAPKMPGQWPAFAKTRG